jgi:hypothetical protein
MYTVGPCTVHVQGRRRMSGASTALTHCDAFARSTGVCSLVYASCGSSYTGSGGRRRLCTRQMIVFQLRRHPASWTDAVARRCRRASQVSPGLNIVRTHRGSTDSTSGGRMRGGSSAARGAPRPHSRVTVARIRWSSWSPRVHARAAPQPRRCVYAANDSCLPVSATPQQTRCPRPPVTLARRASPQMQAPHNNRRRC